MNLLALEPLIVARLKERCPQAQVFSQTNLLGVVENSQVAPALHVVYGGYRVAFAGGEGELARLVQTWIIVVVIRSAVQNAGAATALRQGAGELMAETCAAIMGWAPQGEPFTIANPPNMPYIPGVGYFPLAFTTTVFALGEPA